MSSNVKSENNLSGYIAEYDNEDDLTRMKSAIEFLMIDCHRRAKNAGWWDGRDSNDIPKMLMLCVSELAEAMEADRKNSVDDHLPKYLGFTVELADALIRIFDLAGAYAPNLPSAFVDKLEYNKNRADHKLENRVKDGGKKY